MRAAAAAASSRSAPPGAVRVLRGSSRRGSSSRAPPRPRGSSLRARASPPSGSAAPPFSPGWRTPGMAIFWDLDNLRPPLGFETVWAYRLVEAAFEYADVAHVRAYARVGTLPDFARDALVSAGVTLRECPAVSEGADAALASDVVAIVRGGARALASDAADDEDASSASSASSIERDPNPALEALTRADSFAVMVATRDEGMAECVSFASARRDLCDGALVAGEFLAKAAHRPQFAAALAEGGDVGVTPGYWRILNHVAGKSAKGAMGKSKLARAADATVLWDSRRLFALPGPAEEELEEEAAEEEEEEAEDGEREMGEVDDLDDLVATPGGFSALWIDGKLEPWPPGTPSPGGE